MHDTHIPLDLDVIHKNSIFNISFQWKIEAFVLFWVENIALSLIEKNEDLLYEGAIFASTILFEFTLVVLHRINVLMHTKLKQWRPINARLVQIGVRAIHKFVSDYEETEGSVGRRTPTQKIEMLLLAFTNTDGDEDASVVKIVRGKVKRIKVCLSKVSHCCGVCEKHKEWIRF